ncbi:hypothetical protein C8J56DRAFT_1058409 [Mycena floridula]|nr:hypothetical protein C8J56DRAFT_1058409 [Mycena floridula]
MQFSSFVALAVFAPAVLCASWLDIHPAFVAATSEVATLNASVLALPSTSATAAEALASAIYSDLIKLRKAYDTASASVNTTLFELGLPTNEDATDGCGQDFVPLGKAIASAVTYLADKEGAFTGTSIGTQSLIKQGLTTLEASVKSLNNLWFNIAPADYKQYPISVSAEINAAFDTLLAKF